MSGDHNQRDKTLTNTEKRVQTLLDSSAYRPADEDIDYLNGDDARGIRLLLDYQKPQSIMRREGIDHTIVVFGGTRIVEPATARRKVDEILQQIAADPENQSLQPALARAERVLDKSGYYTVARELGQLVGQTESDDASTTLTMMTGGGPGIMEAANRGAAETNARTIGLNISLPNEQYPNSYITPGLCFSFHYFATRKLHFLLRARALVAFPGGFGTLDELFDTLTLIQTEKIDPLPVVLVGESFWKQALNVPFLLDEGVISGKDAELFWYAETAQEIWQGIQEWYRAPGTPLIK
ncbi:MAG: cytochrome D ubiquinol oxidase subunit II [Gammaproteobacteria bacterium]|nr:MAG: cytochrome D ubiquinol oxidase subunit II [Gammaproteobacteria bacterium]